MTCGMKIRCQFLRRITIVTKKEETLVKEILKKERELQTKITENTKLKKMLASLDAAYKLSRTRSGQAALGINANKSWKIIVQSGLTAILASFVYNPNNYSYLWIGAFVVALNVLYEFVLKPIWNSLKKTV